MSSTTRSIQDSPEWTPSGTVSPRIEEIKRDPFRTSTSPHSLLLDGSEFQLPNFSEFLWFWSAFQAKDQSIPFKFNRFFWWKILCILNSHVQLKWLDEIFWPKGKYFGTYRNYWNSVNFFEITTKVKTYSQGCFYLLSTLVGRWGTLMQYYSSLKLQLHTINHDSLKNIRDTRNTQCKED